jgi:hypothetical protein
MLEDNNIATIMKRSLMWIFLLTVFLLSPSVGEILIPGMVTYDPPPFFAGRGPRTPTFINPTVCKYSSKIRNGELRELQVALRSVGIERLEGGKYAYKQVDDEEIKEILMKHIRRPSNEPKVKKVEQFEFSGNKAFRVRCAIPRPEFRKGGVFHIEIIWVRIKPHMILELHMLATTPEMLESIRKSLSTFKIASDPKFPEIVQNTLPVVKKTIRLGGVRSSKKFGEPIVSGPSEDLYYTGRYFVWVGYHMPKVEFMSYSKISDAGKYAASFRAKYRAKISLLQFLAFGEDIEKNRLDKEEIGKLHQALTEKEIQEILALHAKSADGKPLVWKVLGKNQWQRSDGAMAGCNPNRKNLLIATKDCWPRMH